ncbi:HBS1-like protein, partial [Rhizoclosmatium hyalinum]
KMGGTAKQPVAPTKTPSATKSSGVTQGIKSLSIGTTAVKSGATPRAASPARTSSPSRSGSPTRTASSISIGGGKLPSSVPVAAPPPVSKGKKINVLEEYAKRNSEKSSINLVVIGHVDAGKSTLMGHLLYLLGEVNERTMKKYERDAEKMKKGSFCFAWVLDETEEERSR